MTRDEEVIPSEYLTAEKGVVLLKNLHIFQGFTEKDLIKIYSLGELRLYKPGSNIVIEGETTVGMYLIIDGQVGIFKSSRDHHDDAHLLNFLGPGLCFGEMSFIDHKPRSATVAAQNKVLTYFLDGVVWQRTLDTDQALALLFYKNSAEALSKRLRTLDEELIMSQRQLWKYSLSRREA